MQVMESQTVPSHRQEVSRSTEKLLQIVGARYARAHARANISVRMISQNARVIKPHVHSLEGCAEGGVCSTASNMAHVHVRIDMAGGACTELHQYRARTHARTHMSCAQLGSRLRWLPLGPNNIPAFSAFVCCCMQTDRQSEKLMPAKATTK